MNIHKLRFCGEIRKYEHFSVENSALSGAMVKIEEDTQVDNLNLDIQCNLSTMATLQKILNGQF